MRFAAVLLAAALATSANAAQISCITVMPGFGGGYASCNHPTAKLPFGEVHIDEPGTFNATIAFASPLNDALEILGYQDFHFDVYDPAGNLIDGNNGFTGFFVDFNIPAGLTGLSFQYTISKITTSTIDWFQRGETDTIYNGTGSRFELTSNSELPAFTFDVSKVGSAVPEPASWMMMIAGFGLSGAAMRRRRSMQPA